MNREQLKQLENDSWAAADNLRANSELKSSEYTTFVLGLIFLKFVDNNYCRYERAIKEEYQKLKGGRREKPFEIALAKCGFYLPDIARYDYLLNLPKQEDKHCRKWFAGSSVPRTASAGNLQDDRLPR